MKFKTEEEKERMRKWYKDNREHHIAKVKARQKANGYASEKTDKQRNIRCIKRRTRKLYSLINKKCEFCILPATEHHHYTIPIQVDKFNFVCHDCHMEKDLAMNNHSKIQTTKCAQVGQGRR